jgi:hypothetical protein
MELSGCADSMEASMDFSGCAASMEALAWMSSVNRSKTCQSKSLVECEEKSAVVLGGMAKVLLNSPHFLSLPVATVWDSSKFRIYGKIYGRIHRFEWLCKIYGGIHGFQWLCRICGGIHRFEWLCKIYGDIHGFQWLCRICGGIHGFHCVFDHNKQAQVAKSGCTMLCNLTLQIQWASHRINSSHAVFSLAANTLYASAVSRTRQTAAN